MRRCSNCGEKVPAGSGAEELCPDCALGISDDLTPAEVEVAEIVPDRRVA